jgi:hypothetical protein
MTIIESSNHQDSTLLDEMANQTLGNDSELSTTAKNQPLETSDTIGCDEGKAELAQIYKQFGVYGWHQVNKIAKQHPPYLVQNFIPAKSVGILVGEWGIGKSPLAIQLQMAIAAGSQKFLGKYQTQPNSVRSLYVDLENGPDAISKIASDISKFLKLSEPPEEHWKVFSPNYSLLSDLADQAKNTEDLVRKIITQCEFQFVVIDPLRVYAPDAEADNTDAVKVIKRLRNLAATVGTTILLVHHPHKPRVDEDYSLDSDPFLWMTKASGAGALVQNVDFRIGVASTSDDGLMLRSFLRNKGWSRQPQ